MAADNELFEYWAHEASLIPPATWPLLDFRMQRALHDSWGGMQRVAREHPELVAQRLGQRAGDLVDERVGVIEERSVVGRVVTPVAVLGERVGLEGVDRFIVVKR